MQEHQSRVIIGLDIGGANVTAYISIINNGGDPTPTKALQEEQEASIFARFGDGRDCWGNGVMEMTADELAEAQYLKANFKAPPDMGNNEDMTTFAQMVFNTIRDNTHEFYGLKPVWIIGCPSSWPQLDKRAKAKYAALFRQAGMEDIIICEESTAAVSYYDRALKVVTKDNTSKGVLLIDWGSTTLDATFILPPEDGIMKRVETSGCALGAHFIDKAIVYAVLYKQKNYGLEQLRNDEELTWKVQRKYEQDEAFRSLLDCHAKILKETYFRAMAMPGLKPKKTQLRWKETVNLSMETSEWGEGETFYTLGISIQMMEDILFAPIREVVPDFDSYNEFTQNDIGNDSFTRRNERFLEELHDKYTEYARAQDALIMLTGGASQMDFIRKAVSAYFPNHKIDYDNHPELSIGKGLAYYGRETLQNPNWEELIEKEIENEGETALRNEDEEDRTEFDNKYHTEVAEKSERISKCEAQLYQADQLPESWKTTIKNELREELIGELYKAFGKSFSEAFREVYDDEFENEEFMEIFNKKFCESLKLDDRSVEITGVGKFHYERDFSGFVYAFDKITDACTAQLEGFYKSFFDDGLKCLLVGVKEGRISGFWSGMENEYKILQEENFIKLVDKINKHYQSLLGSYGIHELLFDKDEEKDWLYLPQETFSTLDYRISHTGYSTQNIINIIKVYSESAKGYSDRLAYARNQCEKIRQRLEKKKQDILSELRQLAEINSINNSR